MNKLCPCCGQGELVFATIKATGERVIVCDECEALWRRNGPVGDNNFLDMGIYLEDQGLEDSWREFAVEGRWVES